MRDDGTPRAGPLGRRAVAVSATPGCGRVGGGRLPLLHGPHPPKPVDVWR